MIYIWFTGINYSKLAVEKERDSIFTTITTISYGNKALVSIPNLSTLSLCSSQILFIYSHIGLRKR
jgi:hypothetical protein